MGEFLVSRIPLAWCPCLFAVVSFFGGRLLVHYHPSTFSPPFSVSSLVFLWIVKFFGCSGVLGCGWRLSRCDLQRSLQSQTTTHSVSCGWFASSPRLMMCVVCACCLETHCSPREEGTSSSSRVARNSMRLLSSPRSNGVTAVGQDNVSRGQSSHSVA